VLPVYVQGGHDAALAEVVTAAGGNSGIAVTVAELSTDELDSFLRV
jgi:hypothetical protein